MTRGMLLLFVLLAARVDAQQVPNVDASTVRLGSAPCTFSTGAGAPSGGATCDVYVDTGGALWLKTGAGWSALASGGTVTSVGLALPAEFTVSGSPVTSSGTLTGAWATETANRVLAGPTSGGAATPGFRALVANDIPTTLNGTTFTGSIQPSASDAFDLGSASALWRQGYLSQLNATLFAKATQTLYGGWLAVSKNAGTFTAAVASGATSIDFGQTMTTGQFVLVRAADTGGTITEEYLQVGTLVSGTTYNVTRNLSGLGAKNWAAGTPYQVRGVSGDGWIELDAFDPPRLSFWTQGSAYNNSTETIRIGYLTGMPNGSSGQGMYMGSSSEYLRWDGSAFKIVAPDITLGISSAFTTTGTYKYLPPSGSGGGGAGVDQFGLVGFGSTNARTVGIYNFAFPSSGANQSATISLDAKAYTGGGVATKEAIITLLSDANTASGQVAIQGDSSVSIISNGGGAGSIQLIAGGSGSVTSNITFTAPTYKWTNAELTAFTGVGASLSTANFPGSTGAVDGWIAVVMSNGSTAYIPVWK